MGPQFRSFYHVFSHKTPYMIEIVLLVKLITSLLCNLITRNLLNQKKYCGFVNVMVVCTELDIYDFITGFLPLMMNY